MASRLLSILMPVYNERAFLRRIVERVLFAPLPGGLSRELVIVDDGSTDGSGALLDELAAGQPEALRVFHQTPNRGKGAAVARAVEEMRGDIAIIQDADLEYDPADYPRLLEPILSGRADAVFGSRFIGTGSHRVLNYHHFVGNLLLTQLSNLTTGFNLTDMETCYKAVRADLLRTIPLRSQRFGIEPELTAKLAKRGCTVYEVPISYYGRTCAEGKKIGWRDGLAALGVIGWTAVVDDCLRDGVGGVGAHSPAASRRLLDVLARAVEPHLGQRVLQVDAGFGDFSRRLPRRELLVVGEARAEERELLRQAFAGAEDVEVLDIDPASDNSLTALADRALDSAVWLEGPARLEDDAGAVRRLAGVLAPGARLVLVLPAGPGLHGGLDRALGLLRRYDRAGARELLQQAGLEESALFELHVAGAAAWWVASRLLGRERLGRPARKSLDILSRLTRPLERGLNLPGLLLVAVGRKV